ncbi:MAG: hypothetical protein UT96_C0030G0003 [Candidatus Woesebacteria bacterium GW2011_GWC2_40_30]|nr:MAG: hypothetical protein UT96_C0030G0003 [Candidatus Woesebacteria bacterium GW2011_GWC2_40_30]
MGRTGSTGKIARAELLDNELNIDIKRLGELDIEIKRLKEVNSEINPSGGP